ncbi:Z1 domain-containing protein [Rhodococcus gordoniae]
MIDLFVQPEWSDALKNVLHALANQEPRPLIPAIGFFYNGRITEPELVDFIKNAPSHNNALIVLRLALAEWDGSDKLNILDSDGVQTYPGTEQRRRAVIAALGLSTNAGDVINSCVPIHREGTVVISTDFEPWYDEARTKRGSMYWDDYKNYLHEVKNWPTDSITDLERSANKIVERLADPTRPEIKQTKGLVVGYVQSGKTANFTGVIAKAIDAGYRLVVVMTGTIEILRAQTQRRIDMELMGVENVLAGQDPKDPDVAKGLDYQNDEEWINDRFVRHTERALNQPGVARIRRVTTHGSDYKSLPQGMSQLRYERHDRTKPLNAEENLFHTDAYVVVVKKNQAPLKKLIKDLKPLRNMLDELPALVIDDESDLASVNTKDPKKSTARTTINNLITEILEIVPRAQYVGYTATPFANVFIDPDDVRDLFPSNFVLSLPRPKGYMGVQEFHDIEPDWEARKKTVATSNELAYVRSLQGDPDSDQARRTSELARALDAWVLSGAVKKFREAHPEVGQPREYRHHTMLVHEHTSNATHSEAADLVESLWGKGKFTSSAGLARLKALFDSDFHPVMLARKDGAVPGTFDDLKPYVAAAYAEMTSAGTVPVLVVNSDKSIQDQQEALDFDAGKVWRVLVGGTKLSRGFTVEGLTISYFRRKAGQADTLMQAGRWFGFRDGYRDLVRLYIRRDESVDLYEAFEALLLDEEAFRDELAKYEGLDEEGKPIVEPWQIPPLVSQHLPWLRPTARNKMFNAVIAARASVGSFHQLSSIPPRSAKDENQSNLANVIIPLLAKTTSAVDLPYVADGVRSIQPAKIGLISADEFLSYFDRHTWHPDYASVIEPLRKFIASAMGKKRIVDWAIVWPQRKTEAGRRLWISELGLEAPIFKRARRSAPRIDFTGENKRNILAAEPIPEGLPVPVLGQSKTRGVVVISLVADIANDNENISIGRSDVVGLMSLRVPDESVRSKRDLIQYTVVAADQANEIVVDGRRN